jgi:hypothetical protein
MVGGIHVDVVSMLFQRRVAKCFVIHFPALSSLSSARRHHRNTTYPVVAIRAFPIPFPGWTDGGEMMLCGESTSIYYTLSTARQTRGRVSRRSQVGPALALRFG